jgi:LPS-assembly lipoprotein
MRHLLVPLALVALAGCGFRPMYAPLPDGSGPIGAISVAPIDGKAGFVLQTELARLLTVTTGPGTPRVLEVELTESVVRLGYRIDESAQRADLIVRANYTLAPATDGEEALTGSLSTTVSYDIPLSAFGEIAAQDDARERAGENLARMLRVELAQRLAAQR